MSLSVPLTQKNIVSFFLGFLCLLLMLSFVGCRKEDPLRASSKASPDDEVPSTDPLFPEDPRAVEALRLVQSLTIGEGDGLDAALKAGALSKKVHLAELSFRGWRVQAAPCPGLTGRTWHITAEHRAGLARVDAIWCASPESGGTRALDLEAAALTEPEHPLVKGQGDVTGANTRRVQAMLQLSPMPNGELTLARWIAYRVASSLEPEVIGWVFDHAPDGSFVASLRWKSAGHEQQSRWRLEVEPPSLQPLDSVDRMLRASPTFIQRLTKVSLWLETFTPTQGTWSKGPCLTLVKDVGIQRSCRTLSIVYAHAVLIETFSGQLAATMDAPAFERCVTSRECNWKILPSSRGTSSQTIVRYEAGDEAQVHAFSLRVDGLPAALSALEEGAAPPRPATIEPQNDQTKLGVLLSGVETSQGAIKVGGATMLAQEKALRAHQIKIAGKKPSGAIPDLRPQARVTDSAARPQPAAKPITKEELHRLIYAKPILDEFENCIRQHPDGAGTFSLNFSLQPDGKIVQFKILSEKKETTFKKCIAAGFFKVARFRPFSGEAQNINAPFTM